MKRWISALVKAFCVLLPLWCGVSFAKGSTTETATHLVRVPDGRMVAPDIARILNRGELVVALLDKDTPPFVMVKDGVISGVDISLVRQVAAELKVTVRFDRSAKTYDEVVQRVAEGRADLGVSKLARTLKRAQSVQFSTPYLLLDHALLVNRVAFAKLANERSAAQVVRNFTGSIGVLAGSAWEEFARRNFARAKVVPFASWNLAVEAVKRGEIVAAYRDAIEVRTAMLSDPSLALTLRTVSFTDLNSVLCMMVGPRDSMLLSFVNEIVARQTEPVTLNALLKQLQ